jgi:hypothetical protein
MGSSSMPGAYDDVVRLLVPELQRRGLFHKDYEGPTLRDNLGLPIPRAADWHAVGARRRCRVYPGTSSPRSGAYCWPP